MTKLSKTLTVIAAAAATSHACATGTGVAGTKLARETGDEMVRAARDKTIAGRRVSDEIRKLLEELKKKANDDITRAIEEETIKKVAELADVSSDVIGNAAVSEYFKSLDSNIGRKWQQFLTKVGSFFTGEEKEDFWRGSSAAQDERDEARKAGEKAIRESDEAAAEKNKPEMKKIIEKAIEDIENSMPTPPTKNEGHENMWIAGGLLALGGGIAALFIALVTRNGDDDDDSDSDDDDDEIARVKSKADLEAGEGLLSDNETNALDDSRLETATNSDDEEASMHSDAEEK